MWYGVAGSRKVTGHTQKRKTAIANSSTLLNASAFLKDLS
jgi:hypothetical protein